VLPEPNEEPLVIFAAGLAYVNESKIFVVEAINALLLAKVDRFAGLGASSHAFEVAGITSGTKVDPYTPPK
jgi:hypothetical protein